MKLSTNHKLIARNQKISQIVLYASLALLIVGFILSIRNKDASDYTLVYAILLPGILLVQISISLANKWGRSPRPDEVVAASLKGLNNDYSLYTYTTGVPYLLVGPAGLWIINPYHQTGEIIYNADKKHYEQKNGPGFVSKFFAQEGLTSIRNDSERLLDKYDNYKTKNNLQSDLDPQVINLFFSKDATLRTKDAPNILIHENKIKDFIRRNAKKVNISKEKIKAITDQLPDITD